MIWHDSNSGIQNDFKVCDCCGALNPVNNKECFICSWRGSFHTDEKTVADAIEQAKSEYGDNIFNGQAEEKSVWRQIKDAIKRMFCSE